MTHGNEWVTVGHVGQKTVTGRGKIIIITEQFRFVTDSVSDADTVFDTVSDTVSDNYTDTDTDTDI